MRIYKHFRRSDAHSLGASVDSLFLSVSLCLSVSPSLPLSLSLSLSLSLYFSLSRDQQAEVERRLGTFNLFQEAAAVDHWTLDLAQPEQVTWAV